MIKRQYSLNKQYNDNKQYKNDVKTIDKLVRMYADKIYSIYGDKDLLGFQQF